MPKAGAFKFKLSGDWEKMASILDGFEANFKASMEHASDRAGLLVASRIRKRITEGKYAANAKRTALLKGGGTPTPLKDTGWLYRNITWDVINPFVVHVGTNRFARGKGRVNVAKVVHDGASKSKSGGSTVIKVTDKMRAYFRYLAHKHKGFKPLSSKTTHIIIPKRPFIETVIEEPDTRAKVKTEWSRGIAAAFAGKKVPT